MLQISSFFGEVFNFFLGIIGIIVLIFFAWGITKKGATFLQSTISGRLSIIEIRFVSAFTLLFLLIFIVTGFILLLNTDPEVFEQWWLYNLSR